jgi:uncharacterized YigZ family protein
MLFTDTYKTLSSPSEGEFKDKGSKFIGLAFPITSENEVKEIVNGLKKEHYNAAHHCYAYVLGKSKEVQKSNDDREPNNTAGKPILRSIWSYDLTNTLVVVVRYFGGKLLGVPGLINAYQEAANEALNNAQVIEKIICEQHEVTGDYENENELYKAYKTFGAKLLQHTYNENTFCSIFEIRKSKAAEIITYLKEKRLFELKFIKEQ